MTVVIVEFVNTYLLKVSLDLYVGLKVKMFNSLSFINEIQCTCMIFVRLNPCLDFCIGMGDLMGGLVCTYLGF